MIVPASTCWPSPRLTPSRWPTLSRPFLLDEPAFLCAMRYSSFADSVFGLVVRPVLGLGFVSWADDAFFEASVASVSFDAFVRRPRSGAADARQLGSGACRAARLR